MFIVLRKLSVAILLSFIAMNLAFSQDIMCNRVLSNGDLIGKHSLVVGPGTLGSSEYTFPFPQSPASPATIRLQDGEILLESGDGHLKMTLFQVFGDDEQWALPVTPVFEANDNDKVTTLGCTIGELPRYVGQGWFISEDNVTVPSTMHLIVNAVNDEDGGTGIAATGIMVSKADGLTLKVKIEIYPAIE